MKIIFGEIMGFVLGQHCFPVLSPLSLADNQWRISGETFENGPAIQEVSECVVHQIGRVTSAAARISLFYGARIPRGFSSPALMLP